jgi:hypothetical protein
MWHMVNDEVSLASQTLSQISSTRVNLAPLRQVVNQEVDGVKERHRSIALAVKTLVDAAPLNHDLKPMCRGRAMVWDFTKENVEDAHALLPDELRASSRDGVVTMFCIRSRVDEEVGRYMISGQPALREKMEIAIVHWPQQVCVGVVTVFGGEPPMMKLVQAPPQKGASIKIRDWIQSLPRDERFEANWSPVRSLEEFRSQLAARQARASQPPQDLRTSEQRGRRGSERDGQGATEVVRKDAGAGGTRGSVDADRQRGERERESRQAAEREAAIARADKEREAVRAMEVARAKAEEETRRLAEEKKWRQWWDRDANSLGEAALVKKVGGRVTLKRRDGTVFMVDDTQLSEIDRAFLRKL